MRIIKILSLAVLMMVISTLPVSAKEFKQDTVSASTEIRVPIGKDYFIVNGVKQETKVPAYLTDEGVTMIPLRTFLDLGNVEDYEIDWYPERKTVRVIFLGGGRTAFYTAGSNRYGHNEYYFSFEKGKSELVNGVFYLPARAFGKTFNFEIAWEQESTTAIITKIPKIY